VGCSKSNTGAESFGSSRASDIVTRGGRQKDIHDVHFVLVIAAAEQIPRRHCVEMVTTLSCSPRSVRSFEPIVIADRCFAIGVPDRCELTQRGSHDRTYRSVPIGQVIGGS